MIDKEELENLGNWALWIRQQAGSLIYQAELLEDVIAKAEALKDEEATAEVNENGTITDKRLYSRISNINSKMRQRGYEIPSIIASTGRALVDAAGRVGAQSDIYD